MKRLIKKAFGKTLYHGTDIKRLEQITSMGQITPQETEGAGSNGASSEVFEGYTFLATLSAAAGDYAVNIAKREISPPVILELDLDEKALLPDDNDDPEAKTWKDSANFINQVKILGPIDTSYIKMVYFFDDSSRLIEKVPFSQWEQFYNEKLKDQFENFNYDNLYDPF